MPDAADITDDWILARRPARNHVDPARPYAFLVEPEAAPGGGVQQVATIFLTNRECPFRCLMCDLWRNTTIDSVAPGAIPGQIRFALERLPRASCVKLYNSGNFFDPGAIPESDYREIADLVSPFDTVIVESHPKLINRRYRKFRDMVGDRLQVAMGLETVHPGVLARLNKRMTLDDFASAAATLRRNDTWIRAFILIRPPYLGEVEGVEWADRSIDFAFDAGVECCAVIPTRPGNGAIDALESGGEFERPTLASVEAVLDYGLSLRRGRVFADLWDIRRAVRDGSDSGGTNRNFDERVLRLQRMNLSQAIEPPVQVRAGATS